MGDAVEPGSLQKSVEGEEREGPAARNGSSSADSADGSRTLQRKLGLARDAVEAFLSQNL